MTKQEEIRINPLWPKLQTKWWLDVGGNVIVTWDGVMLVYPNLEVMNGY